MAKFGDVGFWWLKDQNKVTKGAEDYDDNDFAFNLILVEKFANVNWKKS